MRVVFMGTPDFAVGTLKAIIEAGHDVAAVVTQPDKPRGRSKSLVFSPVKEEAVAHGITVLQPERARDEAFVEELRTYNADVIVVVALDSYCRQVLLTCQDTAVSMFMHHFFLSTEVHRQSSGQLLMAVSIQVLQP